MLRRTKENFFSLGVILIITLLFLCSALRLEFFESKIMPLFISVVTLLLLMAAFLNEYTKRRCEVLSEDEDSPETGKGHGKKTLQCLLPLFLLVILIYIFGFYLAALLFVFAYMKVSGSGFASSLLISGSGSVFLYVVFLRLLETPLYTGLLAPYVNPPF